MSLRKPYLGPDTFELQHRDLFFGRNSEGRVVASMIASEPVSILTGASGTGKSSLLRAQVMPTLMSRGWCAIYAHPQGDPLRSLRDELVSQALPNPALEHTAIERLLEAAKGKLNSSAHLSEYADWFSGLPVNDPRRSQLLTIGLSDKIPRYPLIVKMLAGILEPKMVASQLSALAGFLLADPLAADPSIEDLQAYLDRSSTGREKLVQLLTTGEETLYGLAERIWLHWARPLDMLGVILVLDQAEELYTSFGAMRAGEPSLLHDWRLRENLFNELRWFVNAPVRRPVGMAFSLRPEWYGMLRISLAEFSPDESRGVYFLSRFDREDAADAISEPAAKVGGSVAPEAIEFALDRLSAEADRHEIDLFLLAISCHFAWQLAEAETPEAPRIEKRHFERIANAANVADAQPPETSLSLAIGAMHWLLDSALGQLDPADSFDGVSLLESLFNEDRTRRIVPQKELTDKPLRDSARLAGLIDRLESAGLIRRFSRGDLTLVEVRHERIAYPVFQRVDALRDRDDLRQKGQQEGVSDPS